MLNKNYGFAPGRRASVGNNLPGASGNYMNLQGQGTVEALAAALAACCLPCPPGGAVPPQQVQHIQSQMNAPQRCRRTMMGLAKFTVPGLGTATATTFPNTYAFRGLRLIVPTDLSASGDLTGLEVGTEKQIVLSEAGAGGTNPGIPLRAFDQTGQDTGFIDMDWCPPGSGSGIKVTVTNKFIVPITPWEGALEGLQLL
jgi:hypothetical protein